MIRINIKDKIATVEGSPVIVCGNSDYAIHFAFDDEWADKATKTARFVYLASGLTRYQDVVFTGYTVNVPVLANIDEVFVGVFAGELSTTTPARIPCERSIRCGTGAPGVPTPDQYDQIMAAMAGLAPLDEWITIADETKMEEAAYVFFNTDVNGNTFSCKKIIAKIYAPTGNKGGLWVSTKEEFWEGIRCGVNLVETDREITIIYDVVIGKFAAVTIVTGSGLDNGKEQYFWQNSKVPQFIFTENDVYKMPMSGIRVGWTDSDNNAVVFPVGTRIKVWGVKA